MRPAPAAGYPGRPGHRLVGRDVGDGGAGGHHGLEQAEGCPGIALAHLGQGFHCLVRKLDFGRGKAFLCHQSPPQQGSDVRSGQLFQDEQPGAADEGAVHLETGVLRGGPDEGDVAALHPGQQGVLLGLVEAMNLVQEQDGALARGPPKLGRLAHDGFQLPGPHGHRAVLQEAGAGQILRIGRATVAMRERKRYVLAALANTVVLQFFVVLAAYTMSQALRMQGDFTLYFICVPIGFLIAAVPISPPQAFGVMEWAYVQFFTQGALNPVSAAVAFALANRLTQLFWALPGGGGVLVPLLGAHMPSKAELEALQAAAAAESNGDNDAPAGDSPDMQSAAGQ